jgi:hypothetical protein
MREVEAGSRDNTTPASPPVPSFGLIGTILPSRPARSKSRRAQRLSRMARLRATASAARSVLDRREHDGTLDRVGGARPRHQSTLKKSARRTIKKRDHAYWRQPARSAVPSTDLRCRDRRFHRWPDSRKANKVCHQCSFNLGDRALGTYCETWQRHELIRQRSLSAPVPDNLRLPAFGPQVPKMRFWKQHNAADLSVRRRSHNSPIAVRLTLVGYGLFSAL